MGISLISWGKKNQTAKYYTQSSVHISLTFFPVVKLIQIHVVNSNGTEKKKKEKSPGTPLSKGFDDQPAREMSSFC